MTTVKNIIFNFDGTGQDALSDGITLGNVPKLHLLFGGDFVRDASNSLYGMPNQVSFYYNGVGTYGNLLRRAYNYIFGNTDANDILDEAVSDLRKYYKTGDKVFVTGFSRGAALARRFCAQVSKEDGLQDVKVEMLICFDTVAAIGLPDFSTENRPDSDVLFEDCKIASNIVQALHCCSIDDKRRAFQPTLMNKEDRVTEVWFAGAHSDIGGGYRNRGLSDIVLQFVLDELERRKVGLQLLDLDDLKYEDISAETRREKAPITRNDIEISPDVCGENHGPETDGLLGDDRRIVVIENDKIISDAPVLHHTVIQCMAETSYKPENVTIVPHKRLVLGNGLITKHKEHNIVSQPRCLMKCLESPRRAIPQAA